MLEVSNYFLSSAIYPLAFIAARISVWVVVLDWYFRNIVIEKGSSMKMIYLQSSCFAKTIVHKQFAIIRHYQ
jgi:hypothetical protein